jgi:hypothetical protein
MESNEPTTTNTQGQAMTTTKRILIRSIEDSRLNAKLDDIASRYLEISTLAEDLDEGDTLPDDLTIGHIRGALKAAFEAGRNA